MTTLQWTKLADCETYPTGMEQKPSSPAEILQHIFMTDHDAVQLEQYFLENERNIILKEIDYSFLKSFHGIHIP